MNQKEFIVEQKVEGKNKSDLKNGVQQVFVLPPNLLKKLGIHLGDVESTHTQGVCDLEQTKSNENNVETNLCNISSHVSKTATSGSYDEPSIIKTASLMKQSVFLSPTFSSSGIINCTVSTNHNVEESNHDINEVIEKCNTSIFENNYAHNFELLASNSEEKKDPKEEVYNKLNGKIEANINEENVCMKEKYIQLKHEPEGAIKPSLLNDTNNSVNIISEEIVSLSKLNELKACIPSKKDLVPASLNTVLVKRVRNYTIPQTVILPNSNENTLNSTIQLSKPKAEFNISNEIATEIATETCLNENYEGKESLSNKCLLSKAKTLTNSEKNESYKPENAHENETKQNIASQLEPNNKNVKKDCKLLFANEFDTEIDNENEFKSKSDINCIPVTLTDIEVDRKNCVWNKTDIRNTVTIVKPVRLQKDNTVVKLNNDQEFKNEAFNKISKEKENAVIELENRNTLPDKINSNHNRFDTIEPSKKRIKIISGNFGSDFDHLSGVTRNLKSDNGLSEGLTSDTPNIPKSIESIRVCQQSSQDDKIICDSVNNNITNEGVLEKRMIKSANTYAVKRQLKSVEIEKSAIIENDPKANHNDKENVIILTKSQATVPNVGCVNIIKNRFGSNELDKEMLKCAEQTDIVIDLPEVNRKECTLEALILPHENMVNMAEDYDAITKTMNVDNCNTQEFSTQQMTKNANDLANDFKPGQKSSLPYVDNDQDVNNELKLTSSSERNVFISKLCIQGVEKPGGVNLKENKNRIKIRTYSNNRKNKVGGHSGSCIDNVINVKENFENTSIDLLPNASASLAYNQKFCICEDFGILDCDLLHNTYEHVHFLERRLLDCTSDIIFSMYIDDETVNYKDTVENISYVHDSYNEIDIDYVCWNNADSIQNRFNPSYKEEPLQDLSDTQITKSEFDIAKVHLNNNNHSSSVTIMELNLLTEADVKGKPINNEHLNPHIEVDISDNLQNESRKRKISVYKDNDDEVPKPKKLQISVKCSVCEEEIAETQLEDHIAHHGFMYVKENKNDEIESGNNNIQINANRMTEIDKQIKCGVCKVDVIGSGWLTHIATTHNYIAWKDGEKPINLKEERDVKDHLQRTIQELGQLVCSTCGLRWKYAKPYLQHIKRCCGVSNDFNTSLVIKNKLVECAVCHTKVDNSLWNEHIAKQHNYLAWKVNENAVDFNDNKQLRKHFGKILSDVRTLVCAKCGFECQYAKAFIYHLESCTENIKIPNSTLDESIVNVKDADSNENIMEIVKCGVCEEDMASEQWVAHIKDRHNYKAWKHGETPLDFESDTTLRNHLYKIVQMYGHLECTKCGKTRKYVKMYLQHIQTCTGPDLNETATAYDDLDSIMDIPSAGDTVIDSTKPVTCGVCLFEMKAEEWLEHIQNKHNYLAWQVGRKPLDSKNEQLVRSYLYDVVHKLGALVCGKCGISRKYVKMYLQHVESCTGPKDLNETATAYDDLDSIMDIPSAGDSVIDSTKPVTCGVCLFEMKAKEWLEHIQNKHNYLAWQVGRKPLDLKDEQLVRSYLYDVVHKLGALVCGKCGISRKYVKMYLQHVESCTGPKEDQLNNTNTTPLRNIGQCTDLNNSGDVSSVDAGNSSVIDDATLNTLSNDGSDQQSGQDAGASMVKCAVCKQEVASTAWMAHIQKEHNYQAWHDSEDPMNLQDEEAVKQFLNNIMQSVGHLACAKCGAPHKDVELYLQHVSTCTKTEEVIKCGVCSKEMKESSWIQHISHNHEYIAWKETETPLDINNYEVVWQHLMKIIKEVGSLMCSECGLKRKYPKSYLLHVKACYGKTYVISDGGNSSLNESCISNVDTSMDTTINEDDGDGTRVVKCAVCSEEMEVRLWLKHIQKQHDYVAWQEGSTPIDLEDEQSIIEHLRGIERKHGALVCVRCGIVRRKVAVFYRHTITCNGPEPGNVTLTPKSEHQWANPCGEIVKCAVCQSEMSDSEWMSHIANDHDYLAWREGETPLNMNDDASVREHLNMILQFNEKLICSKCGESRKYVKSYLLHLKTCGTEETENDSIKEVASKELSGVSIKCGICQLEMDDTQWLEHIKEHNYVAWKENEQPLVFENEDAVKDYLYTHILQKIGQLTCKKCGLVRKYAKVFLQHIEQCQKITWQTISTGIVKVKKERGDIVKCAVCQEQLDDVDWISHISEKHGYLAWRDRDAPVDLEDEDAVRSHLKDIIQEEGYLQCNKCGVQRKYAKVYLQHVKTCEIKENDEEQGSLCESSVFDDIDHSDAKSIVCGVCKQDVLKAQWIEHIQKEHKYLAWQEGKKPIDTNDNEAVYNYLHAISNKYNGLVCGLCGLTRKYVKPYLTHVNSCTTKSYSSYEILECGVCGEKVEGKSWRDHAIQKHYNIAWVVGETPIDIRSFPAVDKCLREYNEYKHKMVCNICGISRTSHAGFHAHILTCGKSDEEVENLKELCEICNQKFLCIYITQHRRTHITQEMALERKVLLEKKKATMKEDTGPLGPRRAAEKARSVIIDYATKLREINTLKCESCGLETDSKKEIDKHYCAKKPIKEDGEESDISIKEGDSTSESDVTDIDSDVSNEELVSVETPQNNSQSLFGGSGLSSKYTSKTAKLPFTVRDSKRYIQEAAKDYFGMFDIKERLFPQWLDCTYELVPKDLLSQYMPPLEESCKVKMGKGSFTTFKTFEVYKKLGYCAVFTGGCIQCMSWAPALASPSPGCPNVLAAATHNAADCPRLLPTDTPAHAALIQLWNYGDFTQAPKLAFGLAHDYGIVWGMDWCPSGAREVLKEDAEVSGGKPLRLGLMAMACSNGSAYVVSVPYPDKNQSGDIIFYKIKPCAELRRSRGANKYQATCINWCLEKGYTTVRVGYADGTTAMYDLVTESPLLKSKEGDGTVLYPFHEERIHNSCVTGLASSLQSLWSSASPTGAAGSLGGARPVRVHAPLAASAAAFTPHWPSVLLSGDDTIVGHSASELEWAFAGRRVGAIRAITTSAARSRAAAFTPPLLVTMRPHPVFSQGNKTLEKKAIGLLDIIPLALKRSKQSNDSLSMKVEPLTYDEAIQVYGIEYKLEKDLNKSSVLKHMSKFHDPSPERFPLADVPVIAFCSSRLYSDKIAVATHAGIIFLHHS